MAFYIDATSMFSTFATRMTVIPYKAGDYDANGIWQGGALGDGVEVNEPLVPMGRVSQYSEMLSRLDVGEQSRYVAEWLSAGQYELGTVVIHHGKRLIVRNKDDYTDYSNLTVYYLEADDADQDEEASANG